MPWFIEIKELYLTPKTVVFILSCFSKNSYAQINVAIFHSRDTTPVAPENGRKFITSDAYLASLRIEKKEELSQPCEIM